MNLAATDGYRFVQPLALEPGHIDGQGHLNNAAVARMLNDLRIAYIHAGPGARWVEYLGQGQRTVVVRELHIAYDREATIDDVIVGCVRVAARRGKAKIVEQRIVAWVVQLFVEDGVVRDFPDFYWDAVARAEGHVIGAEPRDPVVPWGPPGTS